MDKNDIYLRGAGKKNALFFRRFALINALMYPVSRIGPDIKDYFVELVKERRKKESVLQPNDTLSTN